MPKISIIIPTYNEEKYIRTTLESIRRQPYRDIEVIIADSDSSDRTREIARKAYPKVRIVLRKERGVGIACNAAAKLAKGELLMFIDADTSITRDLLRSYEDAFRDKEVVAATGPIIPLEKTTKSIEFGYKAVSVYTVKLFMKIGKPSTISSNLMVRKESYLKLGGFSTTMNTYYDWDLSNRLGKVGRIVFVEGAVAKTSVRRIEKWGMLRYFGFHAGNVIRYNLFHEPKQDYEPIR
ncbi:MAG TPA: glycosyltransferase [Candidatus Saccharimonadales bacterium]|nr:glycosyltransferase [Candidatus Saccharimonadales bacterium]